MTLEELDKFCVKYHLHKEMALDSTNSGMYLHLPAKLRYVSSRNIGIAVCNNVTYLNRTFVSLHFYTRVRLTETYDEACEIMDSDYMPKLKILKIKERIKDLEKDFEK